MTLTFTRDTEVVTGKIRAVFTRSCGVWRVEEAIALSPALSVDAGIISVVRADLDPVIMISAIPADAVVSGSELVTAGVDDMSSAVIRSSVAAITVATAVCGAEITVAVSFGV